MKYQEWTFYDKKEWPIRGPWDSEPDKVQWLDETTGLPCLIVRNHMGSLCGYVGVDALHPAYQKSYNDVDVSVHGGLTFSDKCHEGGKICHIVEPGEPDNVWWLGFDCAHAGDLTPPTDALRATFYHESRQREEKWRAKGESNSWWFEVYRDIEYVKNECRELARQLKEMA